MNQQTGTDSQIEYYKQKIITLAQKGHSFSMIITGLGETVACYLLLAEKEYSGSRKPFVPIVNSRYWNDLLEFFPGRLEEALACPSEVWDALAKDKNFLQFYGIRYIDKDKYFPTVKDLFCEQLDIPSDTQYRRFPIRSRHREDMEAYFKSNHLIPGKTVFLIPTAGLFGSEIVSQNYWMKFSAAIRKKGGTVFFNSNVPIGREPYGFLPFEDLPDFVSLCGYAVGLRTGLLDYIAAFTNTKILAIYPNQFCPVFKRRDMIEMYTHYAANRNIHSSSQEEHLCMMMDKFFHMFSIRYYTGNEHVVEWIHDTDEEKEIRRIVAELGF